MAIHRGSVVESRDRPSRKSAAREFGDLVPGLSGPGRTKAAAGNQEMQRMLRTETIQASMRTSRPNDPDEQQADRVAEHVAASISDGRVQRKCGCAEGGATSCKTCETENVLQRKSVSNQPGGVAAHRSEFGTLGSGAALPSATRSVFESNFGRDFGRVRVHTERHEGELAQRINARAFTMGPHVVFSAGEYAPDSSSGQRLLAHELTHVVQQGHAPRLSSEGRPPAPVPHAELIASASATQVHRQHHAGMDGGVPAGDPLDAGAAAAGHVDAAAPGSTVDAPGSQRYSRQAVCVARLGGCSSSRSGGIAEPEELHRYNDSCRAETHYDGADIHPTQEECRQYASGEAVDPQKLFRLQTLSATYYSRLSRGELTLNDAQRIDMALRHAYAALQRGGAALPGLPQQVTPPPDMSPEGPAIMMAGAAPLLVVPSAAAGGAAGAAAPTLTLIEGGLAAGAGTTAAGGTAALGAEAGVVAVGGTTAGVSAAAVVGGVLLGVVVVVGVGLVIYLVVTHEDPIVDPTLGDDLDEANDIIQETLDTAQPPVRESAPAPALPEIGRLPHQRRSAEQTCTNEVVDAMQEAVDRHCKELPRGCTEADDCRTLRRNWFRNERCARARERMRRCWERPDQGHEEAAAAARRAEDYCRELYQRKC
jgi:hypothetical protein